MKLLRNLCVFVAVAGLALSHSGAIDAAKKKNKSKGKGNAKNASAEVARKSLQAQLNAINRQLPKLRRAENSAASVLNSANTTARYAGQAIKTAKDKLAKAQRNLESIEETIIFELAADHPIREIIARYDSAKKEYSEVMQSATSSPEYKTALAAIKSSRDYPKQMADLRERTLQTDPLVQTCRSKMQVAKSRLESARGEIIDNDQRWQQASFAIRAARAEVKRATGALEKALTQRLNAHGDHERANDAMRSANAAKKLAQAALKSLPAKTAGKSTKKR